MKSNQHSIYDPSGDEQILCIGGCPSEEGVLMDIQETLYYSKTAGFYLQRQIRQIRKGRTWETAELDECEQGHDSGKTRLLKVLRPMKRDQVIRYVVDIYMPKEGGVHFATHLALDCAGLPPR